MSLLDYGFSASQNQTFNDSQPQSQSQRLRPTAPAAPKIEDDDYGYSYGSSLPQGNNDPFQDGPIDNLSVDDVWTVIASFFDEKGLVNQQLSSFNEFVETTIAETMEEHGKVTLQQVKQHNGMDLDDTVSLDLWLLRSRFDTS